MGSFITIALLVVFALIVIGGVAAVASSLGKRHKHNQARGKSRDNSGHH